MVADKKELPNSHTYFFREPEAIDMIFREIVKPRTKQGRMTCIWSVGCASGEEVFSLAIANREYGGNVEIVGSDLNPGVIEDARSGRFTCVRMRHVTDGRRRRWFEDDDGLHSFISPALRDEVRFQEHDVAEEPALYPQKREVIGEGGWDVILLRNVLIYLDPERLLRTIISLQGSLVPSGILVLGGSEWLSMKVQSRLPGPARLVLAEMGGIWVYRKLEIGETLAEPRISLPTIAYSPKSKPLSLNESPKPSLMVPALGTVGLLRQRGDQLLDREQPKEALEKYTQALEEDPLLPDLHLRTGICHLRLQDEEKAREVLRRSLFLEPELWPAALILGDLLRDHDVDAATRYFAQAEESLVRAEDAMSDQEHDPLSFFLQGRKAALEAVRRRLSSIADKNCGNGGIGGDHGS